MPPPSRIAWLVAPLQRTVTQHPVWIVLAWVALTIGVVAFAPDLTRLAAQGQADLVPQDVESAQAREIIRQAWPDQAYNSVAVAVLHRPTGLTDADRAYARWLSRRISEEADPKILLRVLGPGSQPEIASYLLSPDGTTQLLVAQFDTVFVAPNTHETLAEIVPLGRSADRPEGLDLRWTGDAVFGRDYMANVQKSLDRAAVATIGLLMIVLLIVYRSLVLALIPLATIGVGLLVSRGLLGWMTLAGWNMSSLVELFLVVVLFGCGTDFCLLLSWRYGELWNPANPAQAMRRALDRTSLPLLTSAGTTITGLALMGVTRFELFSATGPSVAIGLAITVLATLTLTPALLVLLARFRPSAFRGLTAPSSGFWNRVGQSVLNRPILVWSAAILVLIGPAIVGLRSWSIHDLVAEMPVQLDSVTGMDLVSEKFGSGRITPLSVLIRTPEDLTLSQGMVLIDDISRMLTRQRRLLEVRSATQPLGSPQPLEPARLDARLQEVKSGFDRMIEGGEQLQHGLTEGAAKLHTALMFEDLTGISVTGSPPSSGAGSRESLLSGLRQVSGAMFGSAETKGQTPRPKPGAAAAPAGEGEGEGEAPSSPQELMARELSMAAEGASQIVAGAQRARQELEAMLADPVGQGALDRLLVTPATVDDNPALAQSVASYIAPNRRWARIDLVQSDRTFSSSSLDQVEQLRDLIRGFILDIRGGEGPSPRVLITGTNAQAADIRAMTERDQRQAWFIIPFGVFLILVLALRDPIAGLNLVLTMVLTYLFALGITHLVFVVGLGSPGIDWKVPYFLFVLLVAVGVDYNVFLMSRVHEETSALGMKAGISRAVAQTGGLISSAAAITACSFAAFMFSPLSSIRQLGFALVVGILFDAILVRPVLVPCGHWLIHRPRARAGKPGGRVFLPEPFGTRVRVER